MPRANSPFLTSISGSLRGGPTFRATSQTPDIVMQTRPVPTDRRTAKQAAVRDAYSRLAYLWKNLSHLDKEPYEIMAETRNLTPWNCWLSFHLPIMRRSPQFYTVFSEGAGPTVTDFSIGGTTGTINGAVFGEINNRPIMTFDGVDDQISFTNQTKYNLENTASLYYIGHINNTRGKNMGLLSCNGPSANFAGWAWYVGPTGIINLQTGNGTSNKYSYTLKIVQNNRVNSIGLMKNGAACTHYLNGNTHSSTAVWATLAASANPLKIGTNDLNTYNYNGKMFLVAKFPYLLTLADYRALDAYYLPFFT